MSEQPTWLRSAEASAPQPPPAPPSAPSSTPASAPASAPSSAQTLAARPPRRHVRTFLGLLRGSLLGAFHDGALSTAKGATYSFLLSIFPGLLLIAHVLASPAKQQAFFVNFAPVLNRILPGPALRLMQASLNLSHPPSRHLLISAAVISIWAAASLMISWMEGFQKAYNAPPFSLVRQRIRAIALAVISIVPIALATAAIPVGGALQAFLLDQFGHYRLELALLFALVRWALAFVAMTFVLAIVYHEGVRRHLTWASVVPGALVATGLWLFSTLAFSLYVRHYAQYATLYGSLAAVVILMVWMYILSLAVLVGAEFNSELELHRFLHSTWRQAAPRPLLDNPPPAPGANV